MTSKIINIMNMQKKEKKKEKIIKIHIIMCMLLRPFLSLIIVFLIKGICSLKCVNQEEKRK